MYILILLLVPLLFLFHTYLAVVGLAVVIVAMYVMRTRPAKRPTPKREDSTFSAGYEN